MNDLTLLPLAAPSPPPSSLVYAESAVRDWIVLLKPRVVALVVFTGVIGLMIAPGHIHPILAFAAILSIAVAAGAAGALNMWYERDIDALMRRTRGRPIPAGRIDPDAALGYGVTLAAAAVVLMGLATNFVAAAALLASIGFYVFVYTIWLKRRTAQNIVIGGAAGAFPPLIGWAAVTGEIGLLPVLLFAIILFWTPPHFWSLALYAETDYQRAGVPMLPVTAGPRATRIQIFAYTVVLVVVSLTPWATGLSGPVFGASAAALGLGYLVASWRVLRDKQDTSGYSMTRDAPARAAFRYSLIYLAVLFSAVAVDAALR